MSKLSQARLQGEEKKGTFVFARVCVELLIKDSRVRRSREPLYLLEYV